MSPVDTAIVTFKDVLDDGVGLSEEIRCCWVLEVVFETTWSWRDALLAETWKSPEDQLIIQEIPAHPHAISLNLQVNDHKNSRKLEPN
jgi:hypothetical protein